MSLFYYFVVISLFLVFIVAVIMSFKYKERLSDMSCMIISMIYGTSTGLTTGVFFGSLYQGNLFYSTLYSVMVGILAGSISGFIFGVIPLLDGFIGGLMGGMMGAMLGEMTTNNQSIIIMNLFLTLSVSTLLLFPTLSIPSEKVGQIHKEWLFKPFFVLLFLIFYLFFGSQLNNQMIISKSSSTDQEKHLHLNSQLLQNESQLLQFTINVKPSQFSYDPAEFVLKKGQAVTLILENKDSVEHDIEIKDIAFEENGNEVQADFHLHAPAKRQTKLTFTPLKQGSYEFYCTIPGHKENGMTGLLIIT